MLSELTHSQLNKTVVPTSKFRTAKKDMVEALPKEQAVPLTVPFKTLLISVRIYIKGGGLEVKSTNKLVL